MSTIDFVLLSEFDILKGSTLRQQYPTPTGVDPQVLAELMLPEGGHSRDTDWTWFMLHHHLPSQDPEHPTDQIYALNLVMTKKDDSAQRGARMKALAICSKKPFIHVFRPLLILALDRYFNTSDSNMLEVVYDAINNSDISKIAPIPEYRRRIIEQTETSQLQGIEKTVLKLKPIQGSNDDLRTRRLSDGALKKRNRSQSDSQSKKRQTVATFDQLEMQNTSLIRRRASVFPENKTQQVTVTAYKVSMKFQIPIISTKRIERIGEFSMIDFIQKYNKTGEEVPTGPIIKELHSSGLSTPNLIVLINAVLTGKRVLFLGHHISASDVCQHVLALVSLASGNGAILRGIAKRCFPYCSLAMLDTVLKCSGYIAGVTNPAFETHPKWWDVLVNVKTGHVTISPDCVSIIEDEDANKTKWFKINSIIKKETQGLMSMSSEDLKIKVKSGAKIKNEKYLSDVDFVAEMVDLINNRFGEHLIRMRLQDYIERFIHVVIAFEREENQESQIALGYNELMDEIEQYHLNFEPPCGYSFYDNIDREELIKNKSRIIGFRNNEVYKNLVEDYKLYKEERPCKGIDLGTEITKLKQSSNLSLEEVRDVYVAFEKVVKQPNQIEELLSYLPLDQGGLSTIALGLFSNDPQVKICATKLIVRIGKHKLGSYFHHQLNPYLLRALNRNLAKFHEFFDRTNQIELEEKPQLKMSDFLSHDMTARNPIQAQKEETDKRTKANNERSTKRATSLAHESEEKPKEFKNIVSGELGREFNFDGSPTKGKATEEPYNGRRVVKSDARITNGAHQYTPEQIEKMRLQNEIKKAELREFKLKHKEAKEKQEALEKEQELKSQDENKNKLQIGEVQEARAQNGRRKPKDHVIERTEKYDIILGHEVDRIYDGYGSKKQQQQQPINKAQEVFARTTAQPQTRESDRGEQYEEGGKGEFVTDAEFQKLGIRPKGISKQNSAEMLSDNSAQSSLRESKATSVQTSAATSRIQTAQIQLPAVKNTSTQVSKPSTTSKFDPSIREYARNNSQEYEDNAKLEKLEKNKVNNEYLKKQIQENKEKKLNEKQASKNQNTTNLSSVNEIKLLEVKRGVGSWRMNDIDNTQPNPEISLTAEVPKSFRSVQNTNLSELELLRIRRAHLKVIDTNSQKLPLI